MSSSKPSQQASVKVEKASARARAAPKISSGVGNIDPQTADMPYLFTFSSNQAPFDGRPDQRAPIKLQVPFSEGSMMDLQHGRCCSDPCVSDLGVGMSQPNASGITETEKPVDRAECVGGGGVCHY